MGLPNHRAGSLRAALENISRDSACGWARNCARKALNEDTKAKECERPLLHEGKPLPCGYSDSTKAKALLRDLLAVVGLKAEDVSAEVSSDISSRAETALLDLDPEFREAWEAELNKIDPEGRR